LVTPEGDSADIWVELPEAEPERARRPRRGRGRGRREDGSDAGAEDLTARAADIDAPDAEAQETGSEETEAVEATVPVAQTLSAETEIPAEPPAKPARARRSRARAPVEADAAVEAEPSQLVSEPAPPAAPEVETPVEAIDPVPSAREPDPAEITAPPPKPRKGWWRRG
jgi:ribonuclease E